MAKKNNKRKRPLKANPKRQAHAQLKGYLYQIWHSVDAWLDLADDEILYLECAEDIDIVSGEDATVTQVKHTQRNITLKSQEVCDAINNFWELQTNNSNRQVKYRFLTTSKIGKEKGNPLRTDKPGIELWSRCSGDEETITKISGFLQVQEKISDEVKSFLEQAEPQKIYEQLIEPITWETGSKPASYVERSINDKLFLHGNRQPIPIPPSDAKKVVGRLLKETLTVATQEENRELTKARFLEIFEEQTTQRIPTQYLQHLQSQVTMMHNVGMPPFEGSSDNAIKFQSLIQTEIPKTYMDVLVPRTDLLTSIKMKLQSEGISIIHGGAGKGKTTLVKLTANALSGKWFWQSFTNMDPLSKDLSLQVAQQLKWIAIAIHNESSQVNVVLDDLSLQSKHLHGYKEELGVVVYNVLNRGAKLLITSQHKPFPNFITSLGLSSIVIDVPDFTMSEIEQFAEEMGCPTNDLKSCVTSIQTHTRGHPKLVHTRLTQLREENWKEKHTIESLLQTPQEVKDEREAARQLVSKLPEDQQKFLYRLSLMHTVFRRDYALNIGEIPEPVQNPGIVLDQLDGPWIDRVNETYFTISPLLIDAAKQVWSKNVTNKLHTQIANAILEADHLTTIEARTVFHHSIQGQNKKGLISVIYSLITAPEDDWQNICQEFSWIRYLKTNPPDEFFPGDFFENHMFRSLQYRFSVEVDPEFAPKILQIWDNETKAYKTHQSYPISRLMLATQALKYNQVQLPAKKLVGYLNEIIDIKNTDKKAWKSYFNSMGQLKENNIDESNFFSFLFSFIYMRTEINASFLSDLIDVLDELQPEIRILLLADFEGDSIESHLLINGVWLAEARRENPDWTRCLEVFNKVIERTIAWDYPHIAAASAKGKAIIHDEKLNDPDTAHEVLQDIISKVGALPAIEEAQAVVYFNQKRFKEALHIYERILPKWNPPSEQLNIGPLEEYRRAAVCAAHLNDWEKAAAFFEEGAKRVQKIENTQRYISLYADAGFAQFKAGNMLDSIKLMTLALQKFEKLPQENTDLKYFTLKKRLACSIGWIAYHEDDNFTSESEEPSVGFCSNQETNEEALNLPDSPIELIWLVLARIECKFGNGITVLEHALQIAEKTTDPKLLGSLSLLELQYDLRNKTLNKLPKHIHHITTNCTLIQKHNQSKKEIEKGINSISIPELTNFASVEIITVIFLSGLLTQLATNRDLHEILAIWRTNSSELPIKENMFIALDLIESMLFGDPKQASIEMNTLDAKVEKRLTAALKVIQNKKTSPENLFTAHTYITTYFIDSPWEDCVVQDLADLLSAQWLEKIKFRAALKMPMLTIPKIKQACNSNEIGKKKIGQILLEVHHAVSLSLDTETLQQLHSLAETPTESYQ